MVKAAFRSWMIIGSLSMLFSGCSSEESSKPIQSLDNSWTSSPVLALDVTDQGILKVAGLPPAIHATSKEGDRRVVLLGEAFVRRHGMIGTNRDLPVELGRQDVQPIIALVDGEAGAWVTQNPPAPWLSELQRLGQRLSAFGSTQDGRIKDRVLPYIAASNGVKGTNITIKAAAMTGRVPGFFLEERELQLLACLDGQTDSHAPSLQAGKQQEESDNKLHCRVQWSSNGDLKSPILKAEVTVKEGLGGPQVKQTNTTALKKELTQLIHNLQSHHTDPLDIGRTVRTQYHGVWTQERWRSAFARAAIQVEVRITQ